MDTKCRQILLHWFVRYRIIQKAHVRTAEMKMKRNKQLGIPVVILSTMVGTSVFASMSASHSDTWLQILVGLTSICAAILASLQTFLNFTAEAEKHRLAATRYSKMKHEIEIAFIELDNASNDEVTIFLKRVQAEWNAINENTPIPDQNIFNKVFHELGGDQHLTYNVTDNQS